MENLDITLENVLNEYDKYILSKLINRPYDFNDLRTKVRDFSKKYNFFSYNENQTDEEIALEVSKKIRVRDNN